MDMYSRLSKALEDIRRITNFVPRIGIVLGSGLGAFAGDIRVIGKIPYKKITGFPVSTVSGHAGQFVFGYINKIPVVLMDGRVHYYEGYSMEEVVMPVRLMALLGAKCVLLTNAAGGINHNYYPGTLMVIKDHISSFVPSPLIGPNDDRIGTRFPDMSHVYCDELRSIIVNTGRQLKISLREGVYIQTTGPNYETPAEIKMFEAIGADAVGMSTTTEAMALCHMGVKVCGISLITNMAAGISKSSLSHEEVKVAADAASEKFRSLVWHSCIAINEYLFPDKKEKKIEESIPEKKTSMDFDDFDDFEIIEIK